MKFWVARILNIAGLLCFAFLMFGSVLTAVPYGWLIFGVIVAAITLIWYLCAAQLGVRAMGGMPLTEIPGMESFVQEAEEYAKKVGFTTPPKLYVQDSPAVNAFAFGHPRNGAVVFTAGTFDHLEGKELIAVLGHEYQHIKQHDSLLMALNMVVAFAIRLATYFLMAAAALFGIALDMFMAMYAGIVRVGGSSGGFFMRMVQAVSNWGLQLINMLLMFATRQAEFRADVAGARMAGLSEGSDKVGAEWMASALEVIHEVNGIEPATGWMARLNASHPPLDARLANLRQVLNQPTAT